MIQIGDDNPRANLYCKGRSILGSNAGGMITKLLSLKNGKIHEVFQVLEIAARTGNPKEYVGAIIRGKDKKPLPPKQAKMVERIERLTAGLFRESP